MKKIKEFKTHCDLLADNPPIGLLLQARDALAEDGPACDDLVMEIDAYISKFRHGEVCPRCSAPLYLSDLPQYGAVCYACNENFY